MVILACLVFWMDGVFHVVVFDGFSFYYLLQILCMNLNKAKNVDMF